MHSFTCGLEEMKRAVSLGLYLGVNGCSLKTQENLDVVKQVPEDRLMIETGIVTITFTIIVKLKILKNRRYQLITKKKDFKRDIWLKEETNHVL
ncbi:17068_t:CDS:2 [Entrophospora sp. SA101]|nr:17068_t:CDS:2 [Entrophospora sp. SA101]